MNLFVFGIGYTAGHYLSQGRAFSRAEGTVRTADKAAALRDRGRRVFLFGESETDAAIPAALDEAELLLISVQPGITGDPVLEAFGDVLAGAPRLRRIVYLSTIGVFGDHGGAWIDERTEPAPQNERGRMRLQVERDWMDLGERSAKSVQVLRLAGIYGPGRNALDDLRSGEARRIIKPGQVFNRIHVDDIARAIDGAFGYAGAGTAWNVTDDEPAPASDIVAYAAELMAVEPPPPVPFEQAALSPMARSFYSANRRVSNRALKQGLGVRLAHPTFREGLTALWRAGEGRAGGMVARMP